MRRLLVGLGSSAAVVSVFLAIAPTTPAAPARHASGPLAVATGWVRAALARERRSLAALDAEPPNWKAANAEAYLSLLALDNAVKSLGKAPASGDLSRAESDDLQDEVLGIKDHDHAALSAINKKDEHGARAALLAAVNAKAHLIKRLTDVGTTSGKVCTAEKPFDVFAIPQGFAGSYADVFPHGVPRNAKHVKFSFVDLATGKAPAAELFPGQTWTAKNNGFLADGRLDIRVDVTGTGFGAQDANKRHWKVVVTWDC